MPEPLRGSGGCCLGGGACGGAIFYRFSIMFLYLGKYNGMTMLNIGHYIIPFIESNIYLIENL